MSELWSMLVPLETLAGGAAVTNPTVLESVGLLIGIPAAVGGLIVLLGRASFLARAGRGDIAEVTDPLWLGGPSTTPELASGDTAVPVPAAVEFGGASARW